MSSIKFALSLAIAALLLTWQNAAAVDLSKATFNGYIDMEYSVADNTSGNANGSFHQHHLSFLLDVPVNEKVSAYMHIEFDHGTNIGTNNGGDIIVENAFIRYIVCDAMQFRFGKALTPFGYYNEIHDATPAFISVFVPKTIYNLDERGSKPMFPKWNTGINVLGAVTAGSTVLDYVVYVGNGEGISTSGASTNEAEADDNRNKAFGARVNIQPTDSMQFGVSYYNGEKAVSATHLNLPHSTVGVMFTANALNFNVLTEYAASDINNIRDIGAYGQLSYVISNRYSPYFRYEFTDPNHLISDDTWTEQILGVNIKPIENLIFKVEVSNNHRDAHYTPAVAFPDYKELRMAVALYF